MKNYTSFIQKKSICFTARNAKIVFLISVVLSISSAGKGQVLYGTTSNGGEGGGTITKYDVSSNILTDVFVYEVPGTDPRELLQASNGKLYGITRSGGSNDQGTIYSLDAITFKYKKLKDFGMPAGAYPEGSLVEGADKKLYGTTVSGGPSQNGTIFSFDPASSIYTTLKAFTYADGDFPTGNLVQLSDGRLYGTTRLGGLNDAGVIFYFDPATSIYTVMKDFGDASGKYPGGSLLKGTDGKLYGIAGGGRFDRGVIYSFDPAKDKYIVLMSFDEQRGYPFGNLMQAANGKLYGTTGLGINGYGTLFSYNLNTRKYNVLKKFNEQDGYELRGSLVQANDGKLYGATASGGADFVGTLFSLDTGTLVFDKLRDFNYSSGAGAQGMIKINDGKLIGGMRVGGSTLSGTVFTFDPGTNAYTTLDIFNYVKGLHPSGALLAASNGKLYGMTSEGGKENNGVIFCFDPVSKKYTKVRDCNKSQNGRHPNANLIEGSDKLLYGTTIEGRLSNGVLFAFDPVSLAYTKLKDFTDGYRPVGGLVQASNGKLYGTTSPGGVFPEFSYGFIFSFDPSTAKYTKIKELDQTTGHHDYYSFAQGLMQANDGKIYGLTDEGGLRNFGVLFSLDPITSKFTTENFSIGRGVDPHGNLIQAFDNKLYGLADGGTHGAGVIFSFDPALSIYKKVRNFNFIDGAHPTGTLVLASDGKLYGSTPKGGRRDEGVLFSYDIKNATFKKLLNLQSRDGVNTLSTLIEYPANPKITSHRMAAPATQVAGTSLFTTKVSPNPSNTNFIIEIKSNLKDEAIEIVVTDISGRKVYQKPGALPGQYRFGDLFIAGVYFITVTQGQNIQTIKVIKEGTSIR